MDSALTTLFEYLRNSIYEPDNATLNIDELPETLRQLGNGLKYYTDCVMETTAFAQALSKGTLDGVFPSRGNEMAAPLKSLHASLRHVTWQAQRIAQGDYNQRVAFMGEFADAFNMMVEQLAEREQNLEDKIKEVEEKSAALAQGNLLLTQLVQYSPHQIFVIDRNTEKILLTNDIASVELQNNPDYLSSIISLISGCKTPENSDEIDITYEYDGVRRYFVISTFHLEWHTRDAEVYTILDVSETRKEIADLETHAFRDELTGLHNRAYGMMTLDLWLCEKRRFILIFTDLDSLKFVNDKFGHAEGDIYINRSGMHLTTFSENAIICRIGGDEFMVLASDCGFDEAYSKMNEIADNLRNDEYQHDKIYTYNMSFGIAAVDKDNILSATDIMGVADSRMYEDKQRNKKRQKRVHR